MKMEDTSLCRCKIRKEIHSDDWVYLPIEYEVIGRLKELEKLRNNPSLTNIQCFSGHQEYKFWTTWQEMKTKDLMNETLKMILFHKCWNILMRKKIWAWMHMKAS